MCIAMGPDCTNQDVLRNLPYGLAVRIPGFHPGGPGSTPGMGTFFSPIFLVMGSNNRRVGEAYMHSSMCVAVEWCWGCVRILVHV